VYGDFPVALLTENSASWCREFPTVNTITLAVAVIFALPLAACTDGEAGQTNNPANAARAPAPIGFHDAVAAPVAAAQVLGEMAAAGSHTTSRTFSRDLDADGIDDYRVVITETFDSAGNLLSRTKDQDFDADGIIDSHVTTRFDGVP
jgi:hypothetical protein